MVHISLRAWEWGILLFITEPFEIHPPHTFDSVKKSFIRKFSFHFKCFLPQVIMFKETTNFPGFSSCLQKERIAINDLEVTCLYLDKFGIYLSVKTNRHNPDDFYDASLLLLDHLWSYFYSYFLAWQKHVNYEDKLMKWLFQESSVVSDWVICVCTYTCG